MKWKYFLPPTGGLLVLLLILALATRSCQEVFYAGMVHVEKGQFGMGCNVCQQHEQPFHLVKLDGFWIDQYEVSNSKYSEFLNICIERGWVDVVHIEVPNSDGYDQVEINGNRATYLYPSVSWAQIIYSNGEFLPVSGKESYPVTVSWQGAQAYCELYKKRLPTEAEWEYSAKGGHLHQSNNEENSYFRYSGSNDANSVAWHLYNSGSSSHLIGGLSPNELNTFDMSGNLREWVNDWYDPNYYSKSPIENPLGPNEPVYIPEIGSTAGKVMRGGSWREGYLVSYEDPNIESAVDSRHVRVTKRDYGCTCNLSDRTGFRCVAPEMTVTIYFLSSAFPKYNQPKIKSSYRWLQEEMSQESMEVQNRTKIDTI